MKTFGKLLWAPNAESWYLEAEAQVILRAKRIFAGTVDQFEGYLLISNSLDNARDLEWFMQRYPLLMSDADFERLQLSSGEHEERESIVDQLLRGKLKPQKFEMALPPREYQALGAHLWLKTGGMLLGDDMGLGKSATAICGLTDKRTRPALVVCMAHLTAHWQREFAQFTPKMKTFVLERRDPYPLPQGLDVLITSYAKLAGWAETLRPVIKSVVFDEIQELRHAGSKKSRAARALSRVAGFRLGLSGTPIFNYGGEIFNVVDVVSPGSLGTRAEFFTEHCTGSDMRTSSLKDAKAFGVHLRSSGLMLRRTRADVGRELPPLTKVIQDCEWDERPMEMVKDRAEQLARIILASSGGARGEKLQASEELSALVRQATGVAKARGVAAFVKLLCESDEKVLLLGWHRSVYEIWLERLKEYRPAMYTGSESVTAKEKARERFINGDARVLIMSLRSGAGLDGLQGVCQTVVFGELDWSPGAMEQCLARVHRDGQRNATFVYYLLAACGSDPIVADILGVKREQVEGLRHPDRDHLEKLETNPERIRELARRYLARQL